MKNKNTYDRQRKCKISNNMNFGSCAKSRAESVLSIVKPMTVKQFSVNFASLVQLTSSDLGAATSIRSEKKL